MQWPLGSGAPFHLEATVRVLQRRPGNRVDIWERDRYLRVLPTARTCVLVGVHNRGTIDEPDLQFAIRSGNPSVTTLASLGRTLHRVLGLDVDPGPFQRLAEGESALRSTALALRGMRPPRFVNLFEAFARVVPFQQMSLEAGVAIAGRLVERFGEPIEHGGRRFYAFPTAQRIAHARSTTLRACGLSARKAEALRYLARVLESGELDEERVIDMTTTDALQRLSELPGIGPWSAALVLLRGLGRLDVFPPGDVGATRGLSALLRVEPGAPLSRAIERFGDLRGYLYFYSLGASLLKKGLIHTAVSERSRDVSSVEGRGRRRNSGVAP
jgi:3-methyladenine DNA glycosylase/8-oxoguanine DNA glycosylase